MEKEIRTQRPTRIGTVVSAGKMDKTVIVAITLNKKHPLYKKVVKQTKKYKVRDDENICGIGDTVEMMETRPISKEVYNRIVRVVEKAK